MALNYLTAKKVQFYMVQRFFLHWQAEGSGYLLPSTDFHRCWAQREYKRNQKASVCVHVLKLLCRAQPQVISSTEDEAAVQRLGPSAPALTMPEEHGPALPDSNTRSIQYGLGSKEQTETNYSSSASPWGYFKSKRYGFVPWTSCQKKSVAQQLLKQCSGRRELPARLTQ